MALDDGTSVGRHGHDQIGAAYLSRLGFSSDVCEIVKDHVYAKKYLTAVDKDYFEKLSDASKMTLKFQVGSLPSN
jgi:2-amino-1-hydroxyethylphosphonate dioxygenase (glycine-forming)